jgi:large subunit ribosomal protein L25
LFNAIFKEERLEIVKLKARSRDGKGKSYTRKARSNGWVPAVLYGRGIDSKALEINYDDFAIIVRKKLVSHIIDLSVDNDSSVNTAIVKDIQRDAINDNYYYHIDFMRVAMDEKVVIDCEIKIVGTAIGIKAEGGILNQPVHTVSVECLPGNIPEHIEVDVTNLHLGEAIHVKDLKFDNLVFKDSGEEVIAVVLAPQDASLSSVTKVDEGNDSANVTDTAATKEN